MAVPLAIRRLLSESDAGEVEPLVGTQFVVAGDHVPVRHIVAEAERGLVARLRRVALEHGRALVARAQTE